jgi:hypothetical protein
VRGFRSGGNAADQRTEGVDSRGTKTAKNGRFEQGCVRRDGSSENFQKRCFSSYRHIACDGRSLMIFKLPVLGGVTTATLTHQGERDKTVPLVPRRSVEAAPASSRPIVRTCAQLVGNVFLAYRAPSPAVARRRPPARVSGPARRWPQLVRGRAGLVGVGVNTCSSPGDGQLANLHPLATFGTGGRAATAD